MTKYLKIGLICMISATILMPVAFVLKDNYVAISIAIITASMLLEVIGLIFVVISLLKKRKERQQLS